MLHDVAAKAPLLLLPNGVEHEAAAGRFLRHRASPIVALGFPGRGNSPGRLVPSTTYQRCSSAASRARRGRCRRRE